MIDNDAVKGVAAESFTVIVPTPAAVGVPLSIPVEALKLRPAGKPEAEKI